MRLFVTIDGTERFPLEGSISLNWDMDRPISECGMTVIADAGFTPDEHEAVVVTDAAGTTIFSGRIVAIDRSIGGYLVSSGKYLARLTCMSNFWLLQHAPQLVTATYSEQSDRAIIQDAVDRAGLSATISTPDANIDIIESSLSTSFLEAQPWEIIQWVLAASAGVIYLTAADVLNYNTPANATAAAWDVDEDSQRGSAAYQVQDLRYSTNHRDPATVVDVRAVQQESGLQSIATASDTTEGTFKAAFEFAGINDDTTAQAIADAIITTRAAPAETVSFNYLDKDERSLPEVNTSIRIDSARYGLSAKTMVVRSVRVQQMSARESLVSVVCGDFYPHASTLLRRLAAGSRRQGATSALRLLGVDLNDSSSQYLSTIDTALDNHTAITVSFWVCPNDVLATGDQTIIHKGGTNAGWIIKTPTLSGKVQVIWNRATTDFSCSTNGQPLANGKVKHVMVTVDTATDTCVIYIDGTSVAISTTVGSGTYNLGSTDALEIGRRTTSSEHFDGWMHEVRFYDGVLDSDAAAVLGSLPNPLASVSPSDLQLHLPLNDYGEGEAISGKNFADRSTNAADATPFASPVMTIKEYDAQDHD